MESVSKTHQETLLIAELIEKQKYILELERYAGLLKRIINAESLDERDSLIAEVREMEKI